MPSFPSSRNVFVSRFLGVLCHCAATIFLLLSTQGVAAASQEANFTNAMGQTIVIHADKNIGTPRLRQGFLHGITYERGKDYSKTVALISALKPKSWRLSSEHNNVYGFVVGEGKLPSTLGTKIVFCMQDVFHVRYGFNVEIGRICRPNQKNCFWSYDTFKRSWLEVINNVMKIEAEKKFTVDYFDVFSEPTTGATKLSGLSPEQLLDIFKSTHDTVRQYRPDAKIVAPDIAGYTYGSLKTFLTFVANNNLRVDALSWHEFQTPEILPAHVSEIQQFIKSQPKLCNPTCPEIHINEYAPPSQDLTPGYAVGWLYYLERAGVDQANRACWDHPKGGSTCWNGFDGMLMQDNVTPQPVYWVYKAYADMDNSRLSSERNLPQTVALASIDESKREIRILAGKYGQKDATGRVTIEVRDFRYKFSSVVAEIIRIPNTRNAVQSLPAPSPLVKETIRVQANSLSIVIPDFRDGEAYSIVVRPGDGGGAQ